MRLLAPALLCVALTGCAHRALITSDPPGASVYVGDALKGPAPQEVRFWWYPFRPMKVRVTAPGYRPVTVRVGDEIGLWYFSRQLVSLRFQRLFGLAPGTTHEIVLIRNHGPAGTWTSEEVTP